VIPNDIATSTSEQRASWRREQFEAAFEEVQNQLSEALALNGQMALAYVTGQLNNLRNDYNRQVETFRERDRQQQEQIDEQSQKLRELESRTRTVINEINAKLTSKADKKVPNSKKQ